MQVAASGPIARRGRCRLEQLQEGFGLLNRTCSGQRDASVRLEVHAQGKISFKSSTSSTAPSPSSVVPA